MACICGHAEEDHGMPSGSCDGDGENCKCAGYEEEEEADKDSPK